MKKERKIPVKLPTLEEFNEYFETELDMEEQNMSIDLIRTVRKHYNISRPSAYNLLWEYERVYDKQLIRKQEMCWKFDYIKNKLGITKQSNFYKMQACIIWLRRKGYDCPSEQLDKDIIVWSNKYDKKNHCYNKKQKSV